jgi:prepilin-type N-terminal cleavage/methylation domain-containing protein
MKPPKIPALQGGFTLVESLIVTFILAIGALALAQVLALGVSMNVRTKDDTELTTIATKYLESLYQVSYRKLVVGGNLNPTPGTEDPAFCTLNVFPESRIIDTETLHKSAATYDVYWQITDGAGVVSGAPFKVITVRVVSRRLQVSTLSSHEVIMSVQVINQFAI